MSYSITGTTITLTRGDTFEALVSATKKDGTPYIPLDGITSEKVAAWDAAEQNAKNYVDGLVASNNEVTAICTEVFGTASA